MEEAFEYLQKLTLKPTDRLSKIKDFLEEVLTNTDLKVYVRNLKKKAQHFDRLREVMRLAPVDGKKGLNDDGKKVNMPAMKEELEKFISLEEIKKAGLMDVGYKKNLAPNSKD